MIMRAWHDRNAVLATAVAGWVWAMSGELRAQSGAEFSAWVNQHLPRSGAIHAVYEDPDSGFEAIYGFDAGSRAWYACFLGKLFARDAAGRFYRTIAPFGPVELYAGHPSGVSDSAVEDAFPFVVLYDITDRAEEATSISRDDAGDWEIGFAFPLGLREYRTGWFAKQPADVAVLYHVSHEGRLTEVAWPEESTSRIIQYAERSEVDGLPVASEHHGPSGWKLRSVVAGSGPASQEFAIETVLARATDEGIFESTIRWRPPGNGGGVELGAQEDAANRHERRRNAATEAPIMPPGPKSRSVSMPLVATGVVFVAVGLYAWKRSR